MIWVEFCRIALYNLVLAKPEFPGDSLFLPQEAAPIFRHIWLELILAAVAVLFLFNWLRARRKIRRIVGRSRISLDSFCDKNHITCREKEILRLVLEGKTCSDIEELLFISKNTARNHVHSIYQKLNVNNRVALINLIRESTNPGLGN